MATVQMPWYNALDKALTPIKPFSQWVLIVIALVTIAVALFADEVVKMAWLVYLVSP